MRLVTEQSKYFTPSHAHTQAFILNMWINQSLVLQVLTHFLVRQHRVALEMCAEQGGTGSVVLAEDGAVDIVETVAGDQTVSARRTGETLTKEVTKK